MVDDITSGAIVAPRAGAWIETSPICNPLYHLLLSHPVRVRGLKLLIYPLTAENNLVAPRAGAWIET